MTAGGSAGRQRAFLQRSIFQKVEILRSPVAAAAAARSRGRQSSVGSVRRAAPGRSAAPGPRPPREGGRIEAQRRIERGRRRGPGSGPARGRRKQSRGRRGRGGTRRRQRAGGRVQARDRLRSAGGTGRVIKAELESAFEIPVLSFDFSSPLFLFLFFVHRQRFRPRRVSKSRKTAASNLLYTNTHTHTRTRSISPRTFEQPFPSATGVEATAKQSSPSTTNKA